MSSYCLSWQHGDRVDREVKTCWKCYSKDLLDVLSIMQVAWQRYMSLSNNVILSCQTSVKYLWLVALWERKPPWLRQIITPILLTVKMLSLGGERLTPKVLDHDLHHDLVILQLLWSFCSFTHLRRPRSPVKFNQFQLPPPPAPHKISSQFIHNFLSNVVHKQIGKQNNATKNITFFLPRR